MSKMLLRLKKLLNRIVSLIIIATSLSSTLKPMLLALLKVVLLAKSFPKNDFEVSKICFC